MKWKITLTLALLLSGCAGQSPLRQTVEGRELYTGVLNVMSDARTAKLISDKSALAIEPWRKAAAAALDSMERDAIAGNETAFSTDSDAFASAVASLESSLTANSAGNTEGK